MFTNMMGPDQPEENLDGASNLKKFGLFLKVYWKSVILVLWPLILTPVLIFNDSSEARCAFVVLIMAMYWVSECLPLGVTGLLPILLFPMLSILPSAQTCACYMNNTIMLFFAGLVLAFAIEHCNLHMRIALAIMKTVGCSHRKLLAGLLIVSTILGMWISNTACTAMMVPIIFAILNELEKEGLTKVFVKDEQANDPENDKLPSQITKGYLLSIAYSATFGGTTTLVGTGTNLVFKGIFEGTFPKANPVGFVQWMAYGTPQAIIQITVTYFYMQIFYMGMFRPKSKDAEAARIGVEGERIANRVMQDKYKNLGKMNFHEKAVSVVFALAVLLWFFQNPGFFPGWVVTLQLNPREVKSSVPIVFIIFLLFIIPKEPRFINIFDKDANKRSKKPSEGLITWKVVSQKMPWHILFLLGGGFAISAGFNASNLSKAIGDAFIPLKSQPPFLVMMVTCFFITFITEFTSNVGISNIMLPVVAQMSVATEVNPLFMMVPATLICSYAFRLPVGTPPNAIVCEYGNIRTKSLIAGGCGVTVYSFIIVMATFTTFGTYVYDAYEFPDWAKPGGGDGGGGGGDGEAPGFF